MSRQAKGKQGGPTVSAYFELSTLLVQRVSSLKRTLSLTWQNQAVPPGLSPEGTSAAAAAAAAVDLRDLSRTLILIEKTRRSFRQPDGAGRLPSARSAARSGDISSSSFHGSVCFARIQPLTQHASPRP